MGCAGFRWGLCLQGLWGREKTEEGLVRVSPFPPVHVLSLCAHLLWQPPVWTYTHRHFLFCGFVSYMLGLMFFENDLKIKLNQRW